MKSVSTTSKLDAIRINKFIKVDYHLTCISKRNIVVERVSGVGNINQLLGLYST